MFSKMYKRISARKSSISGNKDHSRNPISCCRIIYFQGGSACQYILNVKLCSRFLLKTKNDKKRQNDEESIKVVIMSTIVSNVQISKINKVANKSCQIYK